MGILIRQSIKRFYRPLMCLILLCQTSQFSHAIPVSCTTLLNEKTDFVTNRRSALPPVDLSQPIPPTISYNDFRNALNITFSKKNISAFHHHFYGLAQELERAHFKLDKTTFMVDEETFNMSFQRPVEIWGEVGTLSKSLVLWNGNMFVEGFFRSNSFEKFRKLSLTEVMQNQPWFWWNPKRKRYEFKSKGASEYLVQNHYTGPFLYRGLKRFEYQIVSTISDLLRGDGSVKTNQLIADQLRLIQLDQQFSPQDLEVFQKAQTQLQDNRTLSPDLIHALGLEVFNAYFQWKSANGVDLAFFTPDLPISLNWARPDHFQTVISQKELLNLVQSQSAYVGVENGALEIAFSGRSSWFLYMTRMQTFLD